MDGSVTDRWDEHLGKIGGTVGRCSSHQDNGDILSLGAAFCEGGLRYLAGACIQ